MERVVSAFLPSIAEYLQRDGNLVVFILSDEDIIEYTNEAFQLLFGKGDEGETVKQLLGDEAVQLFEPEKADIGVKKALWKAKTSKGIITFNCLVYYKDGHRLILGERALIGGEEIVAKMGALNNELSQMARTLDKKVFAAEEDNRKLQIDIANSMAKAERLSALSAMAAGIAHEISQPLNSIKLAADSAVFWYGRGVGDSPKDIVSDMSVISKQADKIDKIIAHMRSLVHRYRIEILRCDFNEVIKDIADDLKSMSEKRGIGFEVFLDPKLPPVKGNAVSLAEVVTNLVINAVKAFDKADGSDKRLKIATYLEGGYAQLEISDNGPGIDESIKSRIFEPFFTTDTSETGMGLGLPIVRAIVAAHNGQITLADNYPQGAVFRVAIPLDQPLSDA